MRKQKRQMCVRRMLCFFLACVLICAASPSAAQAAVMRTAKNSAVQKKKTFTKTVTIETSGEIIKKKVKSGGSVILPVECPPTASAPEALFDSSLDNSTVKHIHFSTYLTLERRDVYKRQHI